jgi:hypothetical protein
MRSASPGPNLTLARIRCGIGSATATPWMSRTKEHGRLFLLEMRRTARWDGNAAVGCCTCEYEYVRLLMTESSNTCDTHGGSDPRNCVGYAIRELYLGTFADNGAFNDLLHHSPDQKQTLTYCSSVDPWHPPLDLYVAPDRMESGDQQGLAR